MHTIENVGASAPLVQGAEIAAECVGRARRRLSGGATLRFLVTEKTCRASLDWTAEGGCPHLAGGGFPHERGARAYISRPRAIRLRPDTWPVRHSPALPVPVVKRKPDAGVL